MEAMARKKREQRESTGGKYGRFVDPEGLLERALDVFTVKMGEGAGGNLGLRGEKGTGKTFLIHKLCDAEDPMIVDLWASIEYEGKPLKVPELVEISAHEEQGYMDYVAQDIIAGGESRVREQIVLKWLKDCEPSTPRILLIDEANFLSQSVAGFLHSLCDWRQSIWVPELSQYAKRSPLHFMALCMNPFEKSVYTGTKEMNVATADRFTWFDIPYMDEGDECDWLEEVVPGSRYEDVRRLVGFAVKTRAAYRMDLLHVPVTPRNLKDWLMIVVNHKRDIDNVKAYIVGMQLMDQKDQVLSLWEGKEVKEVFKDALRSTEDDDY